MNMLVDFLKFCIKRENDNLINPIHIHNNFEKFLSEYNNGNVKDKRYVDVFNSIKEAHEATLNKTDESAMDYIEKWYTKTKTLPSSNNPGYKLTEEEPITKLNSAAFITTAVVLQGTLVAGLIISLLALVK